MDRNYARDDECRDGRSLAESKALITRGVRLPDFLRNSSDPPMRKNHNAKQMDEAQMSTHPLPESDLMVEDGAPSEGEAVAAVVEEAELLHASVKIGSVAQIVVAVIAVIGLIYLLKLVLVTILAAVLMAFVLDPLVNGLSRIKVPLTNFKATLPALQSELAQQVLKDPYNFDFLTLSEDARERELESGLLEHLRQFLLELGVGFAFVGSQYPFEVGGEDFKLDLLFYHIKLRAFVVIDLKMGPFKPEHAGKMNFYLAAIDDLLRHEDDQPSIGIILCKSKNVIIAEYALHDATKPIGVSEYRLTTSLPSNLRGNLPTIKELEAELKKTKTRD